MGHVKAQVSQLHPAKKGVHVCAVAVDQAAGLMDDAADLDDVGVKETEGARQSDHHSGQIGSGDLMQRLQVHIAVLIRSQLHDLEAGHGGRCWVGAVGAVGDGHLSAAGVAVGQVVGANH